MIISRRFNNNVVLARNDQKDYVLMGKGIGFQVYPNDTVDMEKIEQTFIPSNTFDIKGITELLCDSSPKEVQLVQDIILFGEKVLKKKLNQNLIITLLDHIHFAMRRHEKNMDTKSPIDWEIRQMYRLETRIGVKALSLIEKSFSISLPSSEAVFIAMHFINIQLENETMSETIDFSETMSQINRIVKYHFQIRMDEDSVHYQRFLVHLRYYLIRQKHQETLKTGNETLYFTLKENFPKENQCVEKIASFIAEKYGWEASYDEKLYLILHVNRLIQ